MDISKNKSLRGIVSREAIIRVLLWSTVVSLGFQVLRVADTTLRLADIAKASLPAFAVFSWFGLLGVVLLGIAVLKPEPRRFTRMSTAFFGMCALLLAVLSSGYADKLFPPPLPANGAIVSSTQTPQPGVTKLDEPEVDTSLSAELLKNGFSEISAMVAKANKITEELNKAPQVIQAGGGNWVDWSDVLTAVRKLDETFCSWNGSNRSDPETGLVTHCNPGVNVSQDNQVIWFEGRFEDRVRQAYEVQPGGQMPDEAAVLLKSAQYPDTYSQLLLNLVACLDNLAPDSSNEAWEKCRGLEIAVNTTADVYNGSIVAQLTEWFPEVAAQGEESLVRFNRLSLVDELFEQAKRVVYNDVFITATPLPTEVPSTPVPTLDIQETLNALAVVPTLPPSNEQVVGAPVDVVSALEYNPADCRNGLSAESFRAGVDGWVEIHRNAPERARWGQCADGSFYIYVGEGQKADWMLTETVPNAVPAGTFFVPTTSSFGDYTAEVWIPPVVSTRTPVPTLPARAVEISAPGPMPESTEPCPSVQGYSVVDPWQFIHTTKTPVDKAILGICSDGYYLLWEGPTPFGTGQAFSLIRVPPMGLLVDRWFKPITVGSYLDPATVPYSAYSWEYLD